jgi:hypothetical protein
LVPGDWYDDLQSEVHWLGLQKAIAMNPTRKTKAEDIETALQARIRQRNLSPDECIKEKLFDLQAFICHLAQTPNGKADLQRRIQLLGDCKLLTGESYRHFYGKLRHWLDRDV